MPIIKTEDLRPDSGLDPSTNLQTYCGLDCCVTLEVREELGAKGQPSANLIYDFERALQGPYLELMLRGFAVDEIGRRSAAQRLRQQIADLQLKLNAMSNAVWDRGLNPRSHDQLREMFYTVMHLPEQWISIKGQRKLAMNREVLEKLEVYLHARPIIASILGIRDLAKQLEVLEIEIDPDGRFRTSYNIAGTETGRPSSSTNAFGTGGNAQNIAPGLRFVFVADPGHKLGVIDLEQVEARDVGFMCGTLFGDWSYLDACESGDLHTNNAKRIWPELPWTGNPTQDRRVAEKQFYREFSYRDMAKRGSHLSNYMGTAWTASRHLKVPLGIMEEFQARYCRGRQADVKRNLPAVEPAFQCISRYWQWVAAELQTKAQLITPFGRRRHFFGRPGDDTTLREAIAFLPQSTTADRMNLGMWRVWRRAPMCQLLAQTYDSITFQFPEDEDEDEIIGRALELIRVELVAANGRRYVVPGEAKTGWNWGAESRANPLGLRKWRLGQIDERKRASGLQRVMV